MSLDRRIARLPGRDEDRLDERSWRLGYGTLACPACDAPVAPGDTPLTPGAPLSCPYCRHAGAGRDFLALAAPSRPARVEVVVRVLQGDLK